MLKAPISIVHYCYRSIQMDLVKGPFRSNQVRLVQTRFDLEPIAGEKDKYAIVLGVRKGAEKADAASALFFEIEVVGVFSVDAEALAKDKDHAVSVLRVNGASLLYGAVRQLLLQLTASQPEGPYLLPSYSFEHLR